MSTEEDWSPHLAMYQRCVKRKIVELSETREMSSHYLELANLCIRLFAFLFVNKHEFAL